MSASFFETLKRQCARRRRCSFSGRLLLGAGAVALLGLLVLPRPGYALRFRISEDFVADLDTTVTYAAAWRLKRQHAGLLKKFNGDDGNRNFKRYDMTSNRFTMVSEADLQYGDFGTFVRAKGFYDFAYSGHNSHDSPVTNNNGPLNGGPLADNRDFTRAVKRRYGEDVELLDAYAYGLFRPAGHLLMLRAGRQVISWGESRFIPGVSSTQSPIDATQLNVPGVEIKEVLIPVAQIYGQIDLVDNLALATYYQWEWRQTRLDEAGAYFGGADYLDDGGYHYLVSAPAPATIFATIDRVQDDEPRDDGQWGIAVRYLAEALNHTEFGAYFINYHDKGPQIIGQLGGGAAVVDWTTLGLPPETAAELARADTSSYFFRFADHVQLYGLSVATNTGQTSFGGEVSYRRHLPVQLRDAGNVIGYSYHDADALQAQAGMVHRFGPSVVAESTTLTTEAGLNQLYGVGARDLLNDQFAWGYTAALNFEYFKILPGLDLNVPITFRHHVSGVSSVSGTFAEGRNSASVRMDFTYRYTLKFGIGYTEFVGGTKRNALLDRGFLSSSLKYAL
ncbi:MAG: DUF1302 domain-containing protein [Deltaproteobacteria bacterium]|nr:DUF1302 domain-containing protein [Deltaproteobacteria bacterium]